MKMELEKNKLEFMDLKKKLDYLLIKKKNKLIERRLRKLTRKVFVKRFRKFRFRRNIKDTRKRKYFILNLLILIRRLLVANYYFLKKRNLVNGVRELSIKICDIFITLRVCIMVLKKILFFLKKHKVYLRRFKTVCRKISRRIKKLVIKYRRRSRLFFYLINVEESSFDFFELEERSLNIYELDYMGLKPKEWYLDTMLPSFFEFFIEKNGLVEEKIAMDYKKSITINKVINMLELNETFGEHLFQLDEDLNLSRYKIKDFDKFLFFFKRYKKLSRNIFDMLFKKKTY
jgi:hypothetical protein